MAETGTEPNFFILLDLDPDAPWDETRFAKALHEKQQRWARDSTMGAGKRKDDAKVYYKLVPTIQETMKDPARREQHAKEARKQRSAGRDELLARFQTGLAARTARGYLLEQEVAEMVKTFAAVLSEAEIRRQIAVPIQSAAPAAPARATLDPTMKKLIRDLLNRLGLPDLYAFLASGSGDTVATKTLHDAAQHLYDKTQRIQTKTPELEATAELAGFCLKLFNSDEQRALYDATRAEEQFDGLIAQADEGGRATKAITAGQVQHLLEQARRANSQLDVAEARERVVAHARKQGWAIEVPPLAQIVEQQRCARCGELNSPESRHCRACGDPLTIPCPRCGTVARASAGACQSCGFPLGNRLWVNTLLEEAQRLQEAGDYDAALAEVRRAAAAWPATNPGEPTETIAARRHQIEGLIQQREGGIQAVAALLDERRAYGARDRLHALARLLPPGDQRAATLSRRAEETIAQAEALLAGVRSGQRSGEAAAQLCQQALRLCQDCEEARLLLSRTPPSAPTALVAEVRGQIVELRWQASGSPDVQYVVARQAHTRPVSPAAGARVAAVRGTRFDDAEPPVGLPLYYAIFADREGVPSADAAHLAAPLLVAGAVQGLVARVADGQVHLAWRPPANTQRIFAVRSAAGRPPHGPDDGVRLEALDGEQILDRGLENGREYHYAVYCEFATGTGARLIGPGAAIVAVPQVPPRPIERLGLTDVASPTGRAVRITWDSPALGQVHILKTARPIDRAGEESPAHTLQEYGQGLIAPNPPVYDPWSEFGVRYYTPVVIASGIAYFGRSHRHVCVDDVGNLRAQHLGSLIRLTWDWPPGCTEAFVSYSHLAWPQPGTDGMPPAALAGAQGVATLRVSRAEYDRGGSLDLRQPAPRDHYVMVQAVTRQDGEPLLATGTSDGARTLVRVLSKVTLEYEIQKSLLRRARSLVLRTGKKADLPSLVLLRKRGTMPMNRNDGERILRVEPCSVDRSLAIPIAPPSDGQEGYVRLFLEDERLAEAVSILHPDRDRLKL